jgi:hypothetical protein
MRLRVLLAAFLLVLPFAACAREGGERLVVVARDFAFSGVERTIKGGVIDLTFRNEGQAEHEIAFVRSGGETIDSFKKSFAAVLQGGPFPKYATAGAVPGEIEPGQTLRTRFTLLAGDYTLFCALTDEPGGSAEQSEGDGNSKAHYDLGMIQQVTVEGDDEPAELSAPGGEFAAQDYTFVTPENVTSGERTYTFHNASPTQWHHMVLQRFEGDVSADEAVKAFGTLLSLEEGEAPPAGTPSSEEFGGTGIMSPGLSQTVRLDFEPNKTYVAACFLQDVTGGAPHAIAHKMIKGFTVTE